MDKYVIALDQGTTSSRSILFNKQGEIVSIAQKEFTQYFPNPGWVEHDPNEIWESQLQVVKLAMRKIGASVEQIAAIGIANQRETTIIWDRHTGEPISNAIVWQCRRTADIIDKLNADGLGDYVVEHTGLIPDAYYSGSKISWILDNVPGAREKAEEGRLLFGTVDTWLIWKLTGGTVHVTDYTNASRTMIYDIYKKDWDEKLLEYFRIPRNMLPEVRPSSSVYGYTAESVMGGRIPIAGAAGDQQAALFGQCCFSRGDVKNTYGTGCFTLMNTGSEPVRSAYGLTTTIAASTADEFQYALEGSVFVAGAAVQWLRDELHMIDSSAESEGYCRQVENTGGVYLVPAFVGLGAPYWNQYARGTMVGLTRGTGKAHFIRAVVESMAYQTYDLIDAMKQDLGYEIGELKVDGGASANDFLMQFQADLAGGRIVRPMCVETTALGAAYLAGLAVGYWKDKEEIRGNWQVSRAFEPEITEDERNSLVKGWRRAVRAANAWSEDEA